VSGIKLLNFSEPKPYFFFVKSIRKSKSFVIGHVLNEINQSAEQERITTATKDAQKESLPCSVNASRKERRNIAAAYKEICNSNMPRN
jgi:hypothetical protein